MHDFAALMKKEMLASDTWGYMYFDPIYVAPKSPVQLKILDELAAMLVEQSMDIDRMKEFWHENPALQVPSVIVSFNRYFGPYAVVV